MLHSISLQKPNEAKSGTEIYTQGQAENAFAIRINNAEIVPFACCSDALARCDWEAGEFSECTNHARREKPFRNRHRRSEASEEPFKTFASNCVWADQPIHCE